MADSLRRNSPTKHFILTLLSCLLLFAFCVNDALASPVSPSAAALSPVDAFTPTPVAPAAAPVLAKRVTPVVVGSGNTSTVINPATESVIAQGSGSDGSGTDFSLPAILWLAFAFAVGAPLALAGIRLWRVTTGMGVGLAVALCVWAAFVNTVSADGLSDIVLTIVALGGFLVGFVFGVLDFGRMTGILLIGVLGGFSVGVRVVLLRPGLLLSPYVVNWAILALFMVIGLAAVLVKQRLGLCTSCAALGTFLVGLGVDLLLEKQDGISFALRFLLDRNNSHFLAIVHKGYNPSTMTQIILGASIGAIPVLAFAQHKIFKGPFRPESSQPDAELSSLMDAEPGYGADPAAGGAAMGSVEDEKLQPPVRRSRMQLMRSRFSLT